MSREAAIQTYNKGVELRQQNTVDAISTANAMFGSSVQQDPTFAQGWIAVGDACIELKKYEAAIPAFRKACENLPPATPEFEDVRVKLAHSLFMAGRLSDSAAALGESSTSLGYTTRSLLECAGGELALAVAHASAGFAFGPSPLTETAYALALLFNGEYAKGLKHFEARFPYQLKHFLAYPIPKWDGGPDKTVFVVSDQGIGDALSFSRFVRQAYERCRFMHMAVHPELVRLFKAMFQDMARLDIHAAPCAFPIADCWTTFMSLPMVLGLTDAQIATRPAAYCPPFTALAPWKNRSAKLHVGVAWAGSPANDIDRHRSFNVKHLLRLAEIDGVQCYSLQVGDRVKDLHETGAALTIRDLAPYIRDVSDTLGILDHLDVVVTVESALGHICGLKGIETIIPYSYLGRDWRLGFDGSNGALWYPKHRAVKQGTDYRWEPVFESIAGMLKGMRKK